MKTLENTIKGLKEGRTMKQIKSDDIKLYYRIKGLVSELSEMKAEANGQFISKEDLVEYKGLIIWLMQNKANYYNYLNLKDAMTSLLEKVEKENIIYKSKKGIKGIVSKLSISVALSNVEDNLRKANGISVTENTTGNTILEAFEQHRINTLMN